MVKREREPVVVSEKELFGLLKAKDMSEVCTSALVSFDQDSQTMNVPFFRFTVTVDLEHETVERRSPPALLQSGFVVKYFKSWCLQYLIHASDVPRANKWVLPEELKEGKFFFHGSHELPLQKFSERFNEDPDLFRTKATALGTIRKDFAGDVCVELRPFPRIPVMVVCWQGDADLEPRTTLLFDSSANDQLSIDILWGIGHLVIEVLTNY